MAALQLKHFKENKKASSGPYKGQTYKSILDSKIKDKSQFTIGTQDSSNKVYGHSWNQDKTGAITISYKASKTATKPSGTKPISAFFKDGDFGGGKGSGGGAQDTTWTESLQCYYLSLLYNTSEKVLTEKNTSLAKLKTQEKYCFTYDKTRKLTATDCFENTPEDWFTKQVFIKTANAVYSSTIGSKFKNKTVYFHRGSPFMNSVYKSKKEAQKFDKNNNNPMIAPGTFSDDKWNPGDIWMTVKSPDEKDPFVDNKKYIETPKEWTKLREAVIDNAEDKKTLGISLKKVEGTKATVTPFNTRKRTHNKKVTYKGFKFGQTGDFFNSADIYMYFSEDAVMQLRATATTSSWQGEMKGKYAAGGKIGGGNVNFYVESNFKKSIGFNIIKQNWSETKYTSANLNNMYNLYKTYINKQMPGTPKQKVETLEEFKKKANSYVNPKGQKSAPAFYFGKYMCLLFLESISAETPPNEKLHRFATDIVRYATSNTDISTYFIKVS